MGKLSTEYLARSSSVHPWRVLGIWALTLRGRVRNHRRCLRRRPHHRVPPHNNPHSKQAQTLIDDRINGQETVPETVLVRSAFTVDDAEFQAAVEELESEISGLGSEIVTSVASFYSTGDESFVSADRRSTIILIAMTGTVDDAGPNIGLVYERVDTLDEDPALEVFITGETTFAVDFGRAGPRATSSAARRSARRSRWAS